MTVAALPAGTRVAGVVVVTLIALGLLGGTLRVVAWGAGAMAITAAIGSLVGTVA
jgi:hypothetical protein